jgi:hypothetical protein
MTRRERDSNRHQDSDWRCQCVTRRKGRERSGLDYSTQVGKKTWKKNKKNEEEEEEEEEDRRRGTKRISIARRMARGVTNLSSDERLDHHAALSH